MEKYEGYNLRFKDALVGVQFLFVAFGALVLVPILTGLDTSVALFTAGYRHAAVSANHAQKRPADLSRV